MKIEVNENKKIGYVYCIYELTNPYNCYVGSTIKTIEERFEEHRSKLIDSECVEYHRTLYTSLRNIGIAQFRVKKLERFEYGTRKELREREQFFILLLSPNLNMRNAVKDPDYYCNNKDAVLTRVRNYRVANKEKISDNKNKYYKNNKAIIAKKNAKVCVCESCGVSYTRYHKRRHERSKKHLSSL